MCRSYFHTLLNLGLDAVGDHSELASKGSQECNLGSLWSSEIYGGNEVYLGLGLGVYSLFPFVLGVLVSS